MTLHSVLVHKCLVLVRNGDCYPTLLPYMQVHMVQLSGKLGPCAYQMRRQRCLYAMDEVEELLRRASIVSMEGADPCHDDFLVHFLTTQRGEPVCLKEAKRNVDSMALEERMAQPITPLPSPPSPPSLPSPPYVSPRCWRLEDIYMNECADDWTRDGFRRARRAMYGSLVELRTCLARDECRDLYLDVTHLTNLMDKGEPTCSLFAPVDREGTPCLDSLLQNIRNATRGSEDREEDAAPMLVLILFAAWCVSVWTGICMYGTPRQVERPRVVVACSIPGKYVSSRSHP
jgi:hypothetical protein